MDISQVNKIQDAKDIKRDAVLVNGRLHKGAEEGYDAIIEVIRKSMVDAEDKGEGCIDDDKEGRLMSFAEEVLAASNRTESGGVAYEAIDHLLRHPSFALIRPNSDAAEPIDINISAGGFNAMSQGDKECLWGWGARALVSATTIYVICDSSDPSEVWMTIRATTKKSLACAVGGDAYNRRDMGVIQLSFQ